MQRTVFIAILVTLSVGLPLSPTTASPNAQDETPVTLRVAMPQPENLDPGQLSRFQPNTRDLVENLFVGLTRLNPVTHSVEALLATDWSVSDDGLTWTIDLRDDIYWTRYDASRDSVEAVRQVVAGDVVYAIQRACDPLRPSPVTPNLMAIKGCHTVANAFPEVVNDLFIAREIGARAIGPHQLEIQLLFPASYFPTLLSMPELRPLPRESLNETQALTAENAILTNGPFALQSWNLSGMILIRNPHWPKEHAGNIDRVEVMFTDVTAAHALINNQQVDITRIDSAPNNVEQPGDGDHLVADATDPALMIGFAYDRAVVELPDARRALSLALDREALADNVFAGEMVAAEQFTLPDVVAAPETDNKLYDPVAARAAFEQAGFPDCTNVPEPLILLVPDDDPVWVELANAITQQWAVTLGCNSALFEVKPIARTLLIELAHMNYDPEQVTRSHMWLVTWNADYPDAHAWLNDALHCRYGYIRNERGCSEADRLLDRASLEYDTVARSALYAQVEDLFFGRATGAYPVIPLFNTTSRWLRQPWLIDVNTDGPARYDLWMLDVASRPD